MALAPNALTTPKQIREELGLTSETGLDRLINAASDRIERYCQRSFFYEAARVEKLAGFRSNYLTVSKAPIIEVASLTYDGATIAATEYEIDDDWHIRSSSGFVWTAATWSGASEMPIPGSEERLYVLTYSCGYVTPAAAKDLDLPRTLPYDLEDACIQLVTNRYRAIGQIPGIKSESLLSHSVTYESTSTSTGVGGIPTAIAAMLDPYRKVGQA